MSYFVQSVPNQNEEKNKMNSENREQNLIYFRFYFSFFFLLKLVFSQISMVFF